MLYYSSLHPDWDYQSSVPNEPLGKISEALEVISLNHYRRTGAYFDDLERWGIFLGNGGFLVAMLQSAPRSPLQQEAGDWPRLVAEAAKSTLQTPLWYCYTVAGRLYLLISYSASLAKLAAAV